MTLQSLQRDLQRLTTGEVFTDLVNREVYATGASIYRLLPLAVVRPRAADEVQAIVEFAAVRGVPLTARGAGTAVAGQNLGEGIVIDFAAHLNRVLQLDVEAREVVVEPGVILGRLNRDLKPHGLIFPPDPSSGDYATLGGMIANNSSGPHSLKYKDTRAWTARLKTVLGNGELTWLESKPFMPEPVALESGNLENKIYAGLPRLLEKYASALESSRPRITKNSSGYHLWDLMEGRQVNPVPLVVGSEGTLAMVVKAALRLAPLPAARGVMLLAFERLEDAVAAVPRLVSLGAAAVEIMDRLFIQTVREHREDLRPLLPGKAEAVLLVEFEAESAGAAAAAMTRALDETRARSGDRVTGRIAGTKAEAASLWAIRKAASPILYRLPGKRLTRFVEDVVIPPERLAEGLRAIQEILVRHDAEAPVLGHAGDGNLHLNPRLDLTDPADRQKMARIADEIYGLVIGLGGSISGEHGDGLLRSGYLKRQFPDLHPLFVEIKELFDPHHVLNPGKIVTGQEGLHLEAIAHEAAVGEQTSGASLRTARALDMILRCHGCGLCRTYCPVAMATGEEKGLPRSKLALLRAVALGDLDPDAPEVKAGLESALALCVACQRCLTGCPTGIETADLVQAFLAEHYERHGRRPRERLFALAPAMMAAGSRVPVLAAAADNPFGRMLMETLLGVRRDAPFPQATADTLIGLRGRTRLAETSRRVIFYPGCLGRYADKEGETRSAVQALEALGMDVTLPELGCCGEPLLLAHDLEGARSAARRLVAAVKAEIDAGATLVTACPGCALTIRHVYPNLIGEEAASVAAGAKEFFQFLAVTLGEQRMTLEPTPLRLAVYHRSCHQAALGAADPVRAAIERVPGLRLIRVEDACCGLAGTFGMKVENSELSDALAFKLLEACKRAGTRTVISACPGCRLQIRSLGYEPLSAVTLLAQALSAFTSPRRGDKLD